MQSPILEMVKWLKGLFVYFGEEHEKIWRGDTETFEPIFGGGKDFLFFFSTKNGRKGGGI